MRVVIVEDHPMIRDILIMALRTGADYRIDGYATGQDGIQACIEGADVAVFDHHLPDMTGTDAIKRLRADPRTAHLPVIVVTGEHDTATRLNAIRAGATEFLTKPVDIEEFRLRVSNLLALHKAQKSAQDRGDLLETLIAGSEAAIAVADATAPDRRLLHVSDAMMALFGQGVLAPDTSALTLLDLASEEQDQRNGLRDALQSCTEGRFTLQFAQGGDAADRFWSELNIHPVPGARSDARYLVISHKDISTEMQMRDDLTRVEARLSDIASISQAWFFELDERLRLAYVSEGMAQAFGVQPEAVAGFHVDQLGVRTKDHSGNAQSISALLQAAGPRQVHELLSFKLPDGTLRAVQVSMVPFTNAQGKFSGYRGYAGDVSALAEARDQAQRASRMKSAFLTTISHEMRTPLTAILGLTDVMLQATPESMYSASDAEDGHLAQIAQAAQELTQVLGDVLDVAQMEDGPLTINPSAFDMAVLWDHALAPYHDLACQKGLMLQARITGAHAATRMGDAERVAQILRHVVSNAVKFTDAGHVTLDLDLSAPNQIRIHVRDTGIGIAADKLDSVFDPFRQLDDRMERRFGGQGVGLAIARWLAHSMQGQITLESEEGVGTLARITLPLPQVQDARAQDAAPILDLAGRTVLVTDDSAANRQILKLMLCKLDAQVTLCEDAAAALQVWDDQKFDLLLLDINMPNMTGTELIREIRRREAAQSGRPVPALAVTANAQPDQVRDYLAAGFDGCLAKPFTSGRLLDQISQIV